MIDIKQEAEKLLEYAGISATQRDIDFAADALRSFAERVRNDAIEDAAVHLEKLTAYNFPPEGDASKLTLVGHVINRLRSLKQKTNGTDR